MALFGLSACPVEPSRISDIAEHGNLGLLGVRPALQEGGRGGSAKVGLRAGRADASAAQQCSEVEHAIDRPRRNHIVLGAHEALDHVGWSDDARCATGGRHAIELHHVYR